MQQRTVPRSGPRADHAGGGPADGSRRCRQEISPTASTAPAFPCVSAWTKDIAATIERDPEGAAEIGFMNMDVLREPAPAARAMPTSRSSPTPTTGWARPRWRARSGSTGTHGRYRRAHTGAERSMLARLLEREGCRIVAGRAAAALRRLQRAPRPRAAAPRRALQQGQQAGLPRSRSTISASCELWKLTDYREHRLPRRRFARGEADRHAVRLSRNSPARPTSMRRLPTSTG